MKTLMISFLLLGTLQTYASAATNGLSYFCTATCQFSPDGDAGHVSIKEVYAEGEIKFAYKSMLDQCKSLHHITHYVYHEEQLYTSITNNGLVFELKKACLPQLI